MIKQLYRINLRTRGLVYGTLQYRQLLDSLEFAPMMAAAAWEAALADATAELNSLTAEELEDATCDAGVSEKMILRLLFPSTLTRASGAFGSAAWPPHMRRRCSSGLSAAS